MRHGFTLVELSIVLVILGLLIGGILTGQSLIRAAELRAVTTEFNQYQTAVQSFRDRYFALPGDMKNATEFWGSAGGTGSNAACFGSTTGTGTQTCNGDGDGNINRADDSEAAGEYGERFTFWQHLANAELIEGSYTGIAGPNSVIHSIIGVNIPASRLSSAGWSVSYWNTPGNYNAFAFNYNNHFTFGSIYPDQSAVDVIITPEESWNIDKKIDDGKPGTGSVMARWWDDCTDAATHGGAVTSDRTNAQYALSMNSIECSLMFPNSF